jgi:hypothetical protein
MSMRRPIAYIFISSFALGGCDTGTPHSTVSKTWQSCAVSYADASKRSRFEMALEQAKVPHETITLPDGQLAVQSHGQDCEQFQATMLALFGPDLPSGRNLHFDADRQAQFKKWLTEQGIPFRTEVRDGSEFVVWETQDATRVAAWEHFPRDYPMLSPSTSNPSLKRTPRRRRWRAVRSAPVSLVR